jgi:hypothetical protein
MGVPAGPPAKSTLDTAGIAKIVGHDGEQSGEVYKITVGRADIKLKEMGAVINARIGLNTWAEFYGTTRTPRWRATPFALVGGHTNLLQLDRLGNLWIGDDPSDGTGNFQGRLWCISAGALSSTP